MSLTPEQARERIVNDRLPVMMVVEPGHVMLVWERDGMIYHVCIEGWSAGVVEPVCERESDFLRTYLRHDLQPAAPAAVVPWDV